MTQQTSLSNFWIFSQNLKIFYSLWKCSYITLIANNTSVLYVRIKKIAEFLLKHIIFVRWPAWLMTLMWKKIWSTFICIHTYLVCKNYHGELILISRIRSFDPERTNSNDSLSFRCDNAKVVDPRKLDLRQK